MAMNCPQLTPEQCKQALADCMAAFEVPANKARMEAAIADCNEKCKDNPQMLGMTKMMTLMPIVQEIQGPAMAKYGFAANQTMLAVAQINQAAANDAEMQAQVAKLTAALAGN